MSANRFKKANTAIKVVKKGAKRGGNSPGAALVQGSSAWRSFDTKLVQALRALEEDQYLIISAKRGWAYVQFAAQGSFGLRAESVSNNYLPDSSQLKPHQIAALNKLGWLHPTGTPGKSTPKNQPGGSPNFFRDYSQPVPFEEVARLAIRTLTEVLEIPHPGFLDYKAFDANGSVILIPTLGLMRRAPSAKPPKGPTAVKEMREGVMKALRKLPVTRTCNSVRMASFSSDSAVPS